MNKNNLEELVEIRIKEAKILLDSESYQGAYYLAGYALECAIKACIAKQVQQHDFPNFELANKSYTHKLTDLLGVAGLKQKLNEKEKQDTDFKLNWSIAKDLYDAIINNQSGILTWLKTFW